VLKKQDMGKVLKEEMDFQTMQPKKTTVADALKGGEERLEMEQAELREVAEMIVEEQKAEKEREKAKG